MDAQVLMPNKDSESTMPLGGKNLEEKIPLCHVRKAEGQMTLFQALKPLYPTIFINDDPYSKELGKQQLSASLV